MSQTVPPAANSAGPLLAVEGLVADYGDVRALWGVSLAVGSAEIVALVGSNGAGKSTLMRCIAGLHHPHAGTIHFQTDALRGVPPHRIAQRGILLVPEGRRLFGELTVLDNLLLGAYAARPRQVRQQTLRHVFEVFPLLAERRRQIASTMSGGQQQMLAIGRALMGLPRLLLLDEPSLGLAPLVVRDIFDVVRSINAEGIAVLLVEQNARLALEVADRAYILEQGHVVGEGTGNALLHDSQVQQAYLGYVAPADQVRP
ncbi:MAG: ABC transporter ATP-binding protein [Chloroflexota bacterium]|nr:ABC transporter ATP-binding protein [Chloroflexota bacterium]